jgi:hypothetical protein
MEKKREGLSHQIGAAVFFDLESYGNLASKLLQNVSIQHSCHLWRDL